MTALYFMILTAQPNAYWRWTQTWERRLKAVENKTADIWQVVQCTRLGTPANTHSQTHFSSVKWSIVHTSHVLTSSLSRGSQDRSGQRGLRMQKVNRINTCGETVPERLQVLRKRIEKWGGERKLNQRPVHTLYSHWSDFYISCIDAAEPNGL